MFTSTKGLSSRIDIGEGFPFVLVHGFLGSSEMWDPQKKFFSSKPVLFYDLINHGQSTGGYKLVGDADYKTLIGHVGAITPVPGGVGPMTIAMLVENTIEAAEASTNSSL